MRLPGTIKTITDGGFGFLRHPKRAKDIFFHAASLIGVAFDDLRVGDEVAFDLVEDASGKGPRADKVERDWPGESLDEFEEAIENLAADTSESAVREGVRIFSRYIASLIAQNPDSLREVEWRTLEHVIAEVFEGLGFAVVLTDSSKDGGKDVILGCRIGGRPATYIVEIKHWCSQKRVGLKVIRNFLSVVVREGRAGGLLLSTSGYSESSFEQLSMIDRHLLRFGAEDKVVGLCKTYEKMKSGVWTAPDNLVEVIDDQTI